MNLRMYTAEKDSLFFLLLMYVIPVALDSISIVHKPGVIISTAELLRETYYLPKLPLPFLNLLIPKNRIYRNAWERS